MNVTHNSESSPKGRQTSMLILSASVTDRFLYFQAERYLEAGQFDSYAVPPSCRFLVINPFALKFQLFASVIPMAVI